MRNLGGILLSLSAAIAIMFYGLVYVPVAEKKTLLAQTIRSYEEKLHKAMSTVHLAQSWARDNEAVIQQYMIRDSDDQTLAILLQGLQSIAAQCKVTVLTMNSHPVSHAKEKRIFYLSMQVQGTSPQLFAFVAKIEEWPQRFHVDDLSLRLDSAGQNKIYCQVELNKVFWAKE